MRHQMINKIMTIFKKFTNKSSLVVMLAVGSVMAPSFASADLSLSVNAPAGTASARLHSNCFEWQEVERGQATQVNGSDVWNVTLAGADAWAADCQYKWIVDGVEENFLDNLDGEGNVLPLICAPISGSDFANRVWLVGDGDRTDTYEDCATPTPTGLSFDLTVSVSGSPALVKLTGPWWGWDVASGPEATNNNDGTYTVSLSDVTASMEYLWVSGADIDNLTQENLLDNVAAGECGLDSLNTDTENYANRTWTYGSGDKDSDIYDACQQTGQAAVPASPVPTDSASSVLSVYSDAYTNIDGVNFNPAWNQATVVVDEGGLLTYNGLNYQGTELGANYDVSSYGYLHVDFYTADSTALNFFLISPGPAETAYALDITLNQWNSVDIPLTQFSGVDLTEVFQFKVVGNGTVVFDNLYFGGTPSTDTDLDDDGCENDVDIAPLNADFCDMTAITISDSFGGATLDSGPTYNFPSVGSDTWGGFANQNDSLYPMSIAEASQVSFTASAPGADVALKFVFENQPHPNNSVVVESDTVTVSGSTAKTYTANVPVDATEFNNFLMYLVTQDADVVISDVVIELAEPGDTQNVSLVGEPKGMIGGQLSITVDYASSTGSDVTGLGLNVHYDSSVLTPASVSDVLQTSIFIAPEVANVSPDSANEDNNASTDMLMNMAWASFTGANWPGNGSANLLTITFDVVDNDALDSTVIGFSDSSTAAGYELSAPAVTVELGSGSWDFDGSGSADALTDGLLLLRYAFGLRGSMLTADATDPSSTLTDSEVQALIETAYSSFGDIDASGSTDALTDGLLLLRYLFGLRGSMLVADATDPSAARANGDDVVAYINSYMP